MVLGGRGDAYTETAGLSLEQVIEEAVGESVTTLSGDPRKFYTVGYGGQIGIVERAGRMVSTLSVFHLEYTPVRYAFSSATYGTIGETMRIAGTGLDGSVGYRFGVFRPVISYKYELRNLEDTVTASGVPTTTSTSRSTIFMIGGGLAIDVPIHKDLRFVAQGDYRVPVFNNSNISSCKSIVGQAGFQLGRF
ncbi:MAG: hypothetical protein NDJ90_06160 [Oligoflexia bacterium]|nr:hypothetical protein [Oligoflexia bacterium]